VYTYTQEVIIIAVGNIQVLVSPLNPKLDVLHKCMKFYKRLKGIYVENFPNSLCVNFRELMPSIWNNLLIWKHLRSTRCAKWKGVPNRTLPRKESFQTISSVMYPQSKLKIFFAAISSWKERWLPTILKQHRLVMILFSNWGYVVSKKNHRKHRNLLQNWQISFK